MAKRLRRRGTIWFATVYVDGARKECSTGCIDEAAARAVLAGWERDAADPSRGAKNTTLNDALTRYLIDCGARVRNGDITTYTAERYRGNGGHLVRVLGHDCRIANIKSATIAAEYIHRRRVEGAGDSTIKKELLVLKCALRIAKENGFWFGDLDTVIPDSFDPEYKPKTRELKREELLALVQHLPPNSAAAACFIVATSAEDAALHKALRSDLGPGNDPLRRVHVRGTKNAKRDRFVPIISNEQVVLLEYVRAHAQGTNGKLFGSLANLRRDLADAAKAAKIPHVWPHALRKAAGQFLIDLRVPLELVSRVMGHADTRITETVYAKVRDEDLGDRMLDAIDPRYASRTLAQRGVRKSVELIEHIPEPKAGRVLYAVRGESRTLAQWASASGIPKTTLYSRVVERGMTMAKAIKLGSRAAAAESKACHSSDSDDCRTFAADESEQDGLKAPKRDEVEAPETKNPAESAGSVVPRDGIEPPTRGFSILCSTD
jgi:integrase